ncbi:hypothetical protein PbB2_02638 [Candidatus Phycosocius bacilliformis]|uniref:OmpA-like domain-containing protein n=1 Tax=Candidatus Phycosocius bacilliformis TaxID=1445552 RepID=A0A2P2ED07_9PROT|nr:hypothetical protein [Candidatus Phycosocius bacilliformis]GBF58947.1 hypothetical protein PbB2_02638 [Candidatus Phycosocius bacilliformis]
MIQILRGSSLKRGVGLLCLCSAIALTGCASPTAAVEESFVVGEDICAGEATRIYFPHSESTLSPVAAQVVVRLSDQLATCPKRRVILVSVSGDDAPPSSLDNREERTAIVKQILISQGIADKRIITTAQGPLIAQAPKGPIGSVFVLTRP